ncbi:probable C-mannosyltransferase DPY19L1 isoform X3 [Dermochelys coriacea]|uniref:probable C-mannosyltransferase DPY19L1 isoform X3 n=1 Tax=Dermochelys coriacea TaxID=27794 RepID=UPI001CA95FB2|nr:probable C-mannosyltransferase DPY19L1 isoform X3 [Dermochelys coriacea]
MAVRTRGRHKESPLKPPGAQPPPPQPGASPRSGRGLQPKQPGRQQLSYAGGGAAMRKGGTGRKGAKSEPQKPSRPLAQRVREMLGLGQEGSLRDWRHGLRVFMEEKGAFMRADSKIWFTFILAALAGVLHWCHITTLFENDRHFSHLSTLEREMAFRTEMGLYYSYFKTIVEAPSFWNGMWMIMNDKLTEYPLVINTLKRFNLYPEVVLASWYRIYTGIMDFIGLQTKTCWTVNRGEGLSPVESCEGLGDPASFYVAVIFLLNGVMMSLFFIYGTYLSGSRLGGLVTVSCYFFNHGECTRVMWTPPLRESFSYPFLVLQMLLLTYILRTPNINRGSLIALCVSNVFFMLPWQFAQFVLLTQIASLFAVYVVGYIDFLKLQKILCVHMTSLALCFILMFGNSMLLTSYYAASLTVIWGILELSPKLLKRSRREVSLWAIEGFAWLFGTVTLKYLTSRIFGVADDAHISNLLKSKFIGYKDFDTLMYTCAAEFDFMEKETPIRYTKTLLLPIVLVVFGVIIMKAIKYTVWVLSQKELSERECKHLHPSFWSIRFKLETPGYLGLICRKCSYKMFIVFPKLSSFMVGWFSCDLALRIKNEQHLQIQTSPAEELLNTNSFCDRKI